MGPDLPPLGSPRTSGAPKRVLLGPKRTLFACFLELGGSIWAKTVLNEPGIPLRRSGHPTSLYLKQKEFPKKIGTWKFRDWARITPFGPLGTLKGPDIRSKCVVTISLTPSDHLRAVGTKSGPPGPSSDLLSPQKGLLGPKRALSEPP